MKILKNKTIYTNILGICFLGSLVACDPQGHSQAMQEHTPNTPAQSTQDTRPLTFITKEVIEQIIQANQHAGYLSLATMFQDLRDGKQVKDPLYYAVIRNEVTLVAFLLQQFGADINRAVNNKGQTLLHLAIERDCSDVVEFLLNELHADPTKADSQGQTSLRLAFVRNHENITKLLLHNLTTKLNQVDINGQTSLGSQLSSQHLYPEIVKFLLELEAYPSTRI